jgi:hypothetical protein
MAASDRPDLRVITTIAIPPCAFPMWTPGRRLDTDTTRFHDAHGASRVISAAIADRRECKRRATGFEKEVT